MSGHTSCMHEACREGFQVCPHSDEEIIEGLEKEIERLRAALRRLRDCNWVITPADRMDAVREIAREALGE